MHIAVCHNPPLGGARRASLEIDRRLAQRHQLDLFQLGDGDFDTGPYHRVQRFPFRPQPRLARGFYWNDWVQYRDLQALERAGRDAAAAVDAGDYDVALVSICRWSYSPPVLRHLGTPSVYFSQDPPIRRIYERMCRPEAAPMSSYERARALWQLPSRILLDEAVRRRDMEHARRATLLVGNSAYTAARLSAIYRRPAEFCNPGVDAERFVPPSGQPPERRVISVGALEAHKGFDFVIRALGRIPVSRRPPLTVVGYQGHPNMPAFLRRVAAEAQVDLQVLGGLDPHAQVSDADLQKLYKSHALFAFGAHSEPFGLVLLEAMASGLPVVSVAEGGVSEIVQHETTGLLVERDELALANAVDRILTNELWRRQLGTAARLHALSCSWDKAACQLELQLQSVAKRREPAKLAVTV